MAEIVESAASKTEKEITKGYQKNTGGSGSQSGKKKNQDKNEKNKKPWQHLLSGEKKK